MFLKLILPTLCLVTLVGCSGNDTGATKSADSEQTSTVPLSVACVGDSNTAGYGAESYTSILAERLGDGYAVTNYGVSGTTAMHSGSYPYAETSAYRDSLTAAPDIVVLMFGTNDTADWRGAEIFSREYAELVDAYKQLDSKPRIILCTPPAPHVEDMPGTVSFGVQPAVYDAINAAIRTTAERDGCTVVDIYTLTADHPEWFLDDGIHLANDGAAAVAAAVAADILHD